MSAPLKGCVSFTVEISASSSTTTKKIRAGAPGFMYMNSTSMAGPLSLSSLPSAHLRAQIKPNWASRCLGRESSCSLAVMLAYKKITIIPPKKIRAIAYLNHLNATTQAYAPDSTANTVRERAMGRGDLR